MAPRSLSSMLPAVTTSIVALPAPRLGLLRLPTVSMPRALESPTATSERPRRPPTPVAVGPAPFPVTPTCTWSAPGPATVTPESTLPASVVGSPVASSITSRASAANSRSP